MKKSLLVITPFFLMLGSLSLRAQGDVYLRIRSEGFRPFLIRVGPFIPRYPTDFAERIRQVVSDDLERSGFFYVWDPVVLGGTSPSFVVDGSLQIEGQRLMLQAILKTAGQNETVFNTPYRGDVQEYRAMAHRLADDIVRHLIGEYGIASTRIAYVTRRGEGSQIMLMDYDGHHPRPLLMNGAINLSPAWSPDVKHLLLTTYVQKNPDIALYTLDTGKMRILNRSGGLHASPAWSPDGTRIAFAKTVGGNTDIYVSDPDMKQVVRLTSSPAIDCAPSWSPDGRQIAFTSDRAGSPQIYIMDADGGNVRRLTETGPYNDSPSWSPRGDLIAYVSRESGGFQIYTIDPLGETPRRLTDGRGNHEDPCWSPTGFHMVYASDREGQWDLYLCRWDGSQTIKLTHTGGNVSPAWSPLIR